MPRAITCSHAGCRAPAHAKGFCQKHYDKLRRADSERSKRPAAKKCSVSGCRDPYHARGYCQKHYDLYRKRSSSPAKPSRAAAKAGDDDLCKVEGCGRPHHAKGFCKSHYSKLRRAGGLEPDSTPSGTCEVESCNRPAIANGRCARHLGRPGAAMKRMGKTERLKLIKARHEIVKAEIAAIDQALQTED